MTTATSAPSPARSPWAARAAFLTALILLTLAVSEARAARIEEARFVPLGGIEQWITIRGASRANPVLLILHGGPAEVASPLIEQFAPFEQDFIVVQWDQRGAECRRRTGA